MNHTYETAGNLLIKLAAIDRPAMRHDHQMIYDRAYFKGLLENLIVFVPEARDYVEKIYSREKKWSTLEPFLIANWKNQFAKNYRHRRKNTAAPKTTAATPSTSMDDFRKEQKKKCLDGSKNKRGKYGCRCCRKIRDLNEHKKFSRTLARVRLKEKDKKDLREE